MAESLQYSLFYYRMREFLRAQRESLQGLIVRKKLGKEHFFYSHLDFLCVSLPSLILRLYYISNGTTLCFILIENIYFNNFYSMQNQNSQLKEFEILAKLGEGAFGQVFKVRRKQDGEIYALKKIKMFHMKQKDRINALNQIRILASNQGQNIIGFKQSFYEPTSGQLCIILQYAAQGDLLKKIHNNTKAKTHIPETQIWKALVEITKGLKSLHDKKVLHRDLKSANVFIMEDGTYKLGDLNVSKVLRYEMARTQTGTPYYASPEVWKDRPYGAKSDMWSLGCVLYQMAALKPPFIANDIPGLYRKICAGTFPSIPSSYSHQLSQIINGLLKHNPSLRPSASALLNSTSVKNHYNCEIILQNSSQYDLLKTIKPQNRNWRSINKNLPKAKYNTQQNQSAVSERSKPYKPKQIKKHQQINSSRPISAREKQRSVKDLSIQNKKINNYINDSYSNKQSKKSAEKNRIQKQRQRLAQKRQRILSAGKIRNNSIRLSSKQIQQIVQKCNEKNPSLVILNDNKKGRDSRSISIQRRKNTNKAIPPKPAVPKFVNPLDNKKRNMPPPIPSKNKSQKQISRMNSKQKLNHKENQNQHKIADKALKQYRDSQKNID